MNRRRLLLSYLANSFSWELYSKVYFYNELIPTTINGKNVLNKAKIVKVSGNGEIVNQLVNYTYGRTINNNGIYVTNNNDGSFTISGTSSGYVDLWFILDSANTIVNGHKYLLKSGISGGSFSTYYIRNELNTDGNVDTGNGCIFTVTSTPNRIIVLVTVKTSGITISQQTIFPYLVDLTLMFGTGNEPTSLTDNRIQNILNRGYIAFNLGKYKESDIGVVSTTKADTTALDTITFKAQLNGAINSHDTMEITKANVVFTKNVGSVDLGTLNYTYQSTQQRFYSNGIQSINPNNSADYIPNMLSSNFVANSINGISENQVSYYNNLFFIKGSALGTTNQEAKAYLSGKYLHYELATPQVITIPKKHLGIVDLGSLNWQKESYTYGGQSVYRFKAQVSGIKVITSTNTIHNIYCEKYITDTAGHSFQQTSDNIIALDTNSFVVVNNNTYTTATDFKNAMSGTLLFFETENEVADITDTIDIESGGTITTDSEVLPNIELSVKCK